MDLLPKTRDDFKKSAFWDSFFNKRGTKAFEWYGEYTELYEHLHKYIRPKDEILVIGCGNSKLSADLYDVGIPRITNIDISHVAIKQMAKINQDREEMKFIQMDATKMSFQDNQFSVVLDKGTLDALMPDNSEETLLKVNNMFDEIKRVLRIGGRYICISLLQEHIIKHLLPYFKQSGWMFRVIRCFDPEVATARRGQTSLPVFMVVCTKMNPLPTPIVESCFNGSKVERVSDETIFREIRSIQETSLICSGLGKTNLSELDEVTLDLFDVSVGTPTARYTLYVLDQPHKKKNGKYAAFIVPQGRETEWLFSTAKGRRHLLESAGFDRLAIVTMHRGQRYGTLDDVKRELNESIKTLAPSTNIKTTQNNDTKIPYLSLGVDVGRREIRYEGKSEMSGAFVIEDVYKDEGIYRVLVFLNNQSLVQSEAKLKKVYEHGTEKLVVDFGYLGCDHHKFMSIGVELAKFLNKDASVLIVGLGGGGLCSFLQKSQKSIFIKAVDIDPEIYEIAKNWFNLTEDKKLKVEIADGIKFIEKESAKDNKYDSILFDINTDDASYGMSCPPKVFVEEKFLAHVKECLTKRGIFVLNMVCRDTKIRDDVLRKLKRIFPLVISYSLEQDQNEILYCVNGHWDEWQTYFEKAALNLNISARKPGLFHEDAVDAKQFKEKMIKIC